MFSQASGRLKRRLRKQIFIFLCSVLLPALVLFVFIIRLNRQDNELRKTRAEESQQEMAEEIGRLMAQRLKGIEDDFIKASIEGPAGFNNYYRKYPDLVFVGRIIDEKLRWPWEAASANKKLFQEGRFGELVRQAHQAEFGKKDPELALTVLEKAFSAAASPSQTSLVQLEKGRILSKLGDDERFIQLLKDLVENSGDLTDEYGIPFVLHFADLLSVFDSEAGLILDRLEILMENHRWFPARALYAVRDIGNRIGEQKKAPRLSERTAALNQKVNSALEDLARLEPLEAYVSSQLLRGISGDQVGGLSFWELYGDVPWLVGIREVVPPRTRKLFVFSVSGILSQAVEEARRTEPFPGACRITRGPNGNGILLGNSFPGVRLLFENADTAVWARSTLPFPVLYWLILFLVVGFTVFGAFLLWRDISRELAMADMRTQFAASVSHELKTPLTSIRMFAEALTLGVKTNPEEQKKYLQTIIGESERLSRLLNNVLDFSKIEQGTRTYRFAPTSLEEIIYAVERTMAFPLKQKGFDLRIELGSDIPPVRADRDALEQALLNLLHNAMKYSGDSREIDIKLDRLDNMARIDVSDHGIGISEDNKHQIFAKYFRVPGDENQKIQGTGLGLTIVSHIVEAHQGKVELESRPGEGSTFSLLLPLETA